MNNLGHALAIREQSGNDHRSGFEIKIKSLDINPSVLGPNYIFLSETSEKQTFALPAQTVDFNTHTYIGLARKEVHQKFAKNSCYSSPRNSPAYRSLILETIEFNGSYKRDKCYFLCFIKSITTKYNCSFPGIYETPNLTRNCSDLDNDIDLWKEEDRFEYKDECTSLCPVECEKRTYEVVNNQVFDLARYERVNINYFEIYIYFMDLKIEKTVEIAEVSVTDMLSKIGGLIGFCGCLGLVGFSVLFDIGILISEISRPLS